MKSKTGTIPSGYRFNENEEIELSSARCAEFFNVSDTSIRIWGNKGAPQVERGWWNPKEIAKWLGQGRPEEDEPESDAARKLKAEADLKEEQTIKARFENDVLRGQYFSKEEVAQEWARRCIEFKNGLLAMTKSVANSFTDTDIRITVEEVMRDSVHDILDQYSRNGKYTPKKRGQN